MAKARLKSFPVKVRHLYPAFFDKLLPFRSKFIILKSITVNTMNYGGELFCLASPSTIKPTSNQLDKIVKIIVGQSSRSSNPSLAVCYAELDLLTVKNQYNVLACRAISKYPSSETKTVANSLTNFPYDGPNKQLVWSNRVRKQIHNKMLKDKVFKSLSKENVTYGTELFVKYYRKKQITQSTAAASKFYDKYLLFQSVKAVKKAYWLDTSTTGVAMLLRIRNASLLSFHRLYHAWNLQALDPSYRIWCPCCCQICPNGEDYYHLLLFCPAWKNMRRRLIQPLVIKWQQYLQSQQRLPSIEQQKDLYTMLIGGQTKVFRPLSTKTNTETSLYTKAEVIALFFYPVTRFLGNISLARSQELHLLQEEMEMDSKLSDRWSVGNAIPYMPDLCLFQEDKLPAGYVYPDQDTTLYSNLIGDVPTSNQLVPRKTLVRNSTNPKQTTEPDLSQMKPPLDQQDLDNLDLAFSGDLNRVLFTRFNVNITSKLMQCLLPGKWLNDEVINQYMKLLREYSCKQRLQKNLTQPNIIHRTSYFHSSFLYTKLLQDNIYNYERVSKWASRYDLFNQEKIFFPINIANVHWGLGIAYMQREEIVYLDSAGSHSPQTLNNILRYLGDVSIRTRKTFLDKSKWKLRSQRNGIPLQQNGFDCGTYTCIYAAHELLNQPMEFNQEDMQYFRQMIGVDILNGKISPFPINYSDVTQTLSGNTVTSQYSQLSQDSQPSHMCGNIESDSPLSNESPSLETLVNDFFASIGPNPLEAPGW
jgi:hypothetical protein